MGFIRCCRGNRVEIDARSPQSVHDRTSDVVLQEEIYRSCQLDSVDHGEHYAKWWYSTVHITTAMVGAGVLALPSAMAQLDWWPGMMMLVISWIITLCTLWQMIELHETDEGLRFDRYQDLGARAFGEKLGLWIVGAQQVIVQVTANIAYMVTGGYALKRFVEIVKGEQRTSGRVWWIVIFGAFQLIPSLSSSFNSATMTTISLIATLMSVSYSTIIWIALVGWGGGQHCVCPQKRNYYKAFNAIGDIAFAYGGHNVALEIQATMRSTKEKPNKKPMWNGVLIAYILVAVCYFPVAVIGFWKLGEGMCYSNVLENLQQPKPLIAIINLLVMVHLTGSYQVFAIPMFDLLEISIPRTSAHIFIRPTYVALTCLLATAIPFFGELLGLFGGLALTPTTYFLPCIMWLSIKKPRIFSLSWLANWACIIFGVALLVIALTGSLISITNGFRHHLFQIFHFPKVSNCTKG